MSGKIVNGIEFIKYKGNDKQGIALWECKCSCGKIFTTRGSGVRNGTTKSCGCYRNKILKRQSEVNYKHGKTNEHIYNTWNCMIQRCSNQKNKYYKNYGGKGICVCDEWKNAAKFIEWAFKNGYKDGLTIDRIDNSKGYSPENCRWATRADQNRNTTRNKYVIYKGNKICLAEAARILKINRSYASKLNKTGMLQKMLDEHKED